MKKEEQLQAECIKWFDNRYKAPNDKTEYNKNGEYTKIRYYKNKYNKIDWQRTSLLIAIHNGSYASPITAKKQKALGTSVGAADLLLIVRNKEFPGLFIEMKIKPNKQQPTQKIFQDMVTKQGFGYVLCYSFEEFKTIIINYFKNIKQ